VYPFTRQLEDDEVVIGRLETGRFLALPPDAVELLDDLAAGKTVEQARSHYQQRYGEVPDLEDLLQALEENGFVQIAKSDHQTPQRLQATLTAQPRVTPVHYHFTQISPAIARRLTSRSVLMSCGVMIGFALIAAIIDPAIVPTWKAFFFTENMTLMVLMVTALGGIIVFLHEMAHLVAARAVGVPCRLGLSHRLWVLVAETDMTGVWSIPRQHRYLPFLAGPLLDATCVSILLLILFAQRREWVVLPPIALQLTQAMVLNYLLGLLWQCYFFVRTDLYYVFANFFRCKNLMRDTRVFVNNQVFRMFKIGRIRNQDTVPNAEMRVVRWYAIIFVLGHIAAFSSLILIGLPTTFNYLCLLFDTLKAGYQSNPYAFIDALVLGTMVIGFQGIGFGLWIRSLYRRKRK
jgi:hypothetical protein